MRRAPASHRYVRRWRRELERARAQREQRKFASMRWIHGAGAVRQASPAMSGASARSRKLAAVFGQRRRDVGFIVQSRDGESLCEPNRQTVPLRRLTPVRLMRRSGPRRSSPDSSRYRAWLLMRRLVQVVSVAPTLTGWRHVCRDRASLEPAGASSVRWFFSPQRARRAGARLRAPPGRTFAASLDKIRLERCHAASFLYLQEFVPQLRALARSAFADGDRRDDPVCSGPTGSSRFLLIRTPAGSSRRGAGYGGTRGPPAVVHSARRGGGGAIPIVAHVALRRAVRGFRHPHRRRFICRPIPSICSEIGVPLRLRGETFGVKSGLKATQRLLTEDDINRFGSSPIRSRWRWTTPGFTDSLRPGGATWRGAAPRVWLDRTVRGKPFEYFFRQPDRRSARPDGQVYHTIELRHACEDDTVLGHRRPAPAAR